MLEKYWLNVLAFWPQGMWDPSSPTRDRTRTPCIGRWSLNHWTTREVPWLNEWMNSYLECIRTPTNQWEKKERNLVEKLTRYMNKQFIVKETQMGQKDMKGCFTSLLLREIKNSSHCSNTDGPRDSPTEWSKSHRERQISYDIAYMWNLKKKATNELIYKTEIELRM